MKPNYLSLDVTSPHQVAEVIRSAAREYYGSAYELESAWQDKSAGAPWRKIARILESTANKIDKRLS